MNVAPAVIVDGATRSTATTAACSVAGACCCAAMIGPWPLMPTAEAARRRLPVDGAQAGDVGGRGLAAAAGGDRRDRRGTGEGNRRARCQRCERRQHGGVEHCRCADGGDEGDLDVVDGSALGAHTVDEVRFEPGERADGPPLVERTTVSRSALACKGSSRTATCSAVSPA